MYELEAASDELEAKLYGLEANLYLLKAALCGLEAKLCGLEAAAIRYTAGRLRAGLKASASIHAPTTALPRFAAEKAAPQSRPGVGSLW